MKEKSCIVNIGVYFSFLPLIFTSFFGIGIVLDSLKISVLGFIAVYLFIAIHASILYGFISLYTLYLYTSFLFIYSKLLFFILDYTSILETYWLSHHIYKTSSLYIFLFCVFLHHFVLDAFMAKKKKPLKQVLFSHNKRAQFIGILLLSISLPISLYKSIVALRMVKKLGYIAVYSGALGAIDFPFWTKGSETLLYAGFLFVLLSKPSVKAYLYAVTVLLILLLSSSLRGGRSVFLTSIISCVYFYKYIFQKQIKYRYICIGVIGIILFAMVIGQIRERPTEQKASISSEKIINFFMEQGTSFFSSISMIEWKNEQDRFRKYPYIFSPLVQPYYDFISPETNATSKPSLETLRIRNLGESIISYISSPQGYLEGWGLGGTFIGEMYDCGGFLGVLIWSILLGVLIQFTESGIITKRIFLPLSWFIVNSTIFLPRGRFFEFFLSSYKTLFVMILVFFCLRFISLQRQRIEK